VIAHRGASARAPENTLPALQEALRQGAAGVEVDVQRTSDGVLILVHDDDWLRTTGHAGRVRATSWDQVQRLDAGSWFGADFAGVPVPRLETALEHLPPGCFVNLEIKSPHLDAGLGDAVAAAASPFRQRLHFLLTSFDTGCIERLAAKTDLACGILADRVVETRPMVAHQSLHYAAILARPEQVERVHAAGGLLLAWTVDDASVACELRGLGVDGIITNDPGRIRKELA
jgi:glycerophosphoryl diester phosphodiesterase